VTKGFVILFIDAFSHDYINREDTPFLSSRHVCALTPVFGFKQLAAAFTGLDPLSTGLFAEHYYDPDHSPYKWRSMLSRPLLSTLEVLAGMPIDAISSWVSQFRRLTFKLAPPGMSRYFSIDDSPFPDQTMVSLLLKEKGLSHRFVLFPEVKTNAAAFDLLKALSNSDRRPDFLLVHFPELDPITHEQGTRSNQRRKAVREIDSMIAEATEMLREDSYVLVFSDHGMLDVEGHIDVTRKIRPLGHPGDDFVVFLDSIMARFWVFEDSVSEKIIRLFNGETSGTVILPKKQDMIDRFGHIIFLCSPGYTIFPNHYDLRPPKAMHGYAPIPQNSSLDGIFLASDLPTTLTKERLSMTDVAPILKQAIESL